VADPPIALRSAVTARPVLAGEDPGVTLTVSSDEPPGSTEEGLAAPVPDGFVVPVQGLSAALVLRGFGAPAVKSAALLSVSVQLLPARETESVLEGAGVGPAPSKQFAVAPNPTKSTTPAAGQAPLKAVVPATNATFPAAPAMAIVPVASGIGRGVVPPAPIASCTRKYWPGWTVMFPNDVTCHVVPVALAYCTLMPFRLTADPPRLNSSMKSLVYVAPEFPPPP
jgi:hypothetical protein